MDKIVNIKEADTEQKILAAARKVFFEKGRDGARMQQIADEAGINKSLLHYYFRSKDKLFRAVSEEAFRSFIPNVKLVIVAESTFSEKVYALAKMYVELMIERPYLPLFIINEVSREPELLLNLIKSGGVDGEIAQSFVKSAIQEGYILKADPRHIIISFIGMIVIPFLGKAAFEKIFFQDDAAEYQKFLNERKEFVAQSILKMLK